MAANLMDNLDTYLTVQVRHEKWVEEFLVKYYGPIGDVLMGMMQNEATPQQPEVDYAEPELTS